MASDKLKEFRDWLNLLFTLLTVAVLPICWLALRNQKLEIREEMRERYISTELFKAATDKITAENVKENARLSAENTKLGAEITILNSKLDRIQIQLVRLTDAIHLKDP